MNRPYIIRVSSYKGGVGKTTISANLAVALQDFGNKVLVIDADVANPSIGYLFGLYQANLGYYEVLKGTASLRESILVHEVSGVNVLPGTIHAHNYIPSKSEVLRLAKKIKKQNFDFIIVDTAPGMFQEAVSKFYDEAIIVTIPEMSAIASGVKLSSVFERLGLRSSLVVNRVTGKRYEISIKEIEDVFGEDAKGVLPEDPSVPLSVSMHIPAYLFRPSCSFSKSIAKIAKSYAHISEKREKRRSKGFLPRVLETLGFRV